MWIIRSLLEARSPVIYDWTSADIVKLGGAAFCPAPPTGGLLVITIIVQMLWLTETLRQVLAGVQQQRHTYIAPFINTLPATLTTYVHTVRWQHYVKTYNFAITPRHTTVTAEILFFLLSLCFDKGNGWVVRRLPPNAWRRPITRKVFPFPVTWSATQSSPLVAEQSDRKWHRGRNMAARSDIAWLADDIVHT